MGHDVITCPDCGRTIMEGRNDWECSCGYYTNGYTVRRKPRSNEISCGECIDHEGSRTCKECRDYSKFSRR